jgi:hypothetical protein
LKKSRIFESQISNLSNFQNNTFALFRLKNPGATFISTKKIDMKNFISLLLIAFVIPASAQFKYSAWNIGPQIGKLKIENGMSHYEQTGFGQYALTDSATSVYSITNIRFNVEAVRTNFFVKGGVSLPIVKHTEHDSVNVTGKHFEGTIKFGYGFDIKDKVGFQFGVNFGLYSITQTADNQTGNPTKFDYFVPSAGSTPMAGEKLFGEMGVWEGGLLISNVIAFSDNFGLQTIYSHNNLKSKRKTIDGRNDQLEFNIYYYNLDWHNVGFSLNIMQNWMHFKGYNPADPANSNSFPRIYPPTKISMTTVCIGINFPIVFGD